MSLFKRLINKGQKLYSKDLAGIQYIGEHGITSSCVNAVACLINGGRLITEATIISHDSIHGLLLITDNNEIIAVKAGFSSGYLGTGPRGLSITLSLLERHNVEINEFVASHMTMERLERSCLLKSDLASIKNRPPIIPCRWYEYINDSHDDDVVSKYYPHSIPFALIDQRIIDLAIKFRDNEDASLMSAYRRLEDAIRKRTGIQGEGNKLFSKAFVVENSPLTWNVPDPGEAKGRGQIFTAAFSAFRNARAHRENDDGKEAQLREFLLINELFRLERESLTADELRNAKDDISAAAEFIKSSRK